MVDMDAVHNFKASGFTMSGNKLSKHVSIQWQESFAIVATALTWGHNWQRKCIRFYCNCQFVGRQVFQAPQNHALVAHSIIAAKITSPYP